MSNYETSQGGLPDYVRIHEGRAAAALALYTCTEAVLPPLYPGYIDLETPPDPVGYRQEVQKLRAEVGNPAQLMKADTDPLRHTALALTDEEDLRLQRDAEYLLGGDVVTNEFYALYKERFPNKDLEHIYRIANAAHEQAGSMLHELLAHVTLLPRLAAHAAFETQRDEIFADIMGPNWQSLLASHSTVAPNVLSDLHVALNSEMFYRLPTADLVRMPASWRLAIGAEYAQEVKDMCRLLLRRRSVYLSEPHGWPYGGRGIAPSLLNGTVFQLEADIAAAPSVAPLEIIKTFIQEGGPAATARAQHLEKFYTDARARRNTEARERRIAATAAAAAAAAAARVVVQTTRPDHEQKTADPHETALQALLEDPEVHTALANLEIGSVVHIGSEGKIMPKADFERIVAKHLHLVGYTVRTRAITDPVQPHDQPIEFDGIAEKDIATILDTLIDGSYAKRENLWIAVLPPPDEESLQNDYKTAVGTRRLEADNLARLFLAVDLRSSGKAAVTNVADVVIGVRRQPDASCISIMTARRPVAPQGTDYLYAAAGLVGSALDYNRVNNTLRGGLPGSGRNHS